MFDNFDTQTQNNEIVPEKYEDWLRFCTDAYEASEYEKYDHFDEEDEDDCFEPGRPFVSMFELNP